MTVEWISPAPPAPTPVAARRAEATAGSPAQSEFQNLLEGLGRQLDRGEALVERATAGSAVHLDARELIALQAGIYRYTEVVELTAKFVDRAQNALRTTLESAGR